MQLKNKLYLFLFALPALLLINSCDKKLDIDPSSSIDASEAVEDVEATLIGAYALLGSGAIPGFTADIDAFYGANVIMIPDLLAANNDYLRWSGTFSQYTNIVNHTMINTNNAATETWRRGYQAINIANLVLANLNKETDKDLQGQFEAEARFIRGIVLFELVRLYAQQWVPDEANTQLGVPIPLTPTTLITPDVQIPRATVAEVYRQVLEDLNFAKANLPEDNAYRANTFVASGFLARVYLQQSNFSNALAEANRVITEGPYELVGSVDKIYNTMSAPSSESIFEIQQTDQNNAGLSNGSLYGYYGCGGSTAGNGRGDINPDSTFFKLYEDTDIRKSALFYEGSCTKSGELTTAKWREPYSNYLVMRLTEMYLIRSECNYRLGSTVGADPLEDLNTIRGRANATLLEEISSVEDILFERQLELAFEGFAIHDIRRTQGSVGDLPWNSPKLVLPIPLREINVNKALVQNPGYGG